MVAKKSEIPSYAELLDLSRQIPEGKVSIDQKKWLAAKEDQKRATVIMAEVTLGDVLRMCLTRHFSHNNKTIEKLLDEPLNSLSNKATLAYALDLIDATTRANLMHIYKIRCEFAHRSEVDFADKTVLTLVGKLPRTKGQGKVTAENSFDFFMRTAIKLTIYLVDVWKQEDQKRGMPKARSRPEESQKG